MEDGQVGGGVSWRRDMLMPSVVLGEQQYMTLSTLSTCLQMQTIVYDADESRALARFSRHRLHSAAFAA